MASQIFNREEFQHPADGLYQIEAFGDHPNRAANLIQRIDPEAAQSIVSSFNSDAAAGRLRHGHELLCDHEHFSGQSDQETRAYGWLQELQARDDGIYGRIKWTTTGQAAVDGGDYRFFSTEYAPADLCVVNADQTPRIVRPLRLAGLTLTNMNNNRGQKAITNRYVPSLKALKGSGYDSAAEWKAAGEENRLHVEANKAAAETAAAQSKADTEAEAQELALPAVEKFCRAVKAVLDAGSKSGQQILTLSEAWTLAQQKFPAIYAAAFSDDTAAAGAASAQQVSALANRIGSLAGRNFDFGWNFVRQELPRVFNRLTPVPARIQNRSIWFDLQAAEQRAAKVFNRLVRAESAITGLSDAHAWKAITEKHPGLAGLASGRITPHTALTKEPGLAALLAD